MKTLRGFGFTQRADAGALRVDSNASHIAADSKDCEVAKDSKSGALALIEKPLRALEKGEVLVRNLAVALNPVDYKLLDFFGAAQEGQIMGLDGVGVVVESQSESVEVGGLYAYHADLRGDGSFAEYTILPARALLPLSGHSALSGGNSAFAPFSRFCEREASSLPPQVTPSSALTKSQKSSQNPRIAGDSESTFSESRTTSESISPVIASVAKQSTDSNPYANLEFTQDSETPSGEVYPLRDKNQIARSADLKGVVGERGLSGGEGATSPNSSPSPLDEKEKEILKNNRILEAKAGDSEKLDSETKNQAKSAMAGDSEKRGLESKNLESATDSESKKLNLESKHHLARIASLICPGLTALQCVAKMGEANLRDKSVLVVGANSSVGRIVSFLCEEAGALVFRVSTQAGHNLAESQSRAKPTNALDSQTPESSAHHLSYTELEARAEELKGQFYAVFDCSGRIDSTLLLALLGYYGHFVGVVDRVDSNPLPAFETCISLHEIALGAIHTHGSKQDFTTLQAQATRLFALLENPRFLQCLPPLKVIHFAQIPTALESLKAQNLGAKFVALISRAGVATPHTPYFSTL